MVDSYSVDDPAKIQGRDEVRLHDRSLAALRLQRALDVIGNGPLRILTPGSGAGRYARAMSRYRPNWNVVAGDLSSVAVDEATRLSGGPEYHVFDAEALPFGDQTFDALVFFDLLEHVPHPPRLLSESRRVLKSGGILHFFVPLEAQPRTLYQLFQNSKLIPIHDWKRSHVGHIQRYRDSDVLKMVWDAGFLEIDVAYSFHIIGQIHDIVDYWHRERNRYGTGLLPLVVVNALTRLTFMATWRAAYIEDCLLTGRFLASGLHLTARCP